MNFDKNNINKFINEWIDFREEDLSVLTFADHKHQIFFDEHIEKILKNVPEVNKNFVKKELYELDDEFANYTSYWNRKFYKAGFKDASKLILFGISDI